MVENPMAERRDREDRPERKSPGVPDHEQEKENRPGQQDDDDDPEPWKKYDPEGREPSRV